MRVPLGGLGLSVTKQSAEDRQPEPAGHRDTREGMAKVMQSNITQSGLSTNCAPSEFQIDERRPSSGARNDMRIAFDPRQLRQNPERRRRQV